MNMIPNQDILNHSNTTSFNWWQILLLEYITVSIEYRMLAPGLSPGRYGFNPRPVHGGLVVEKLSVGQVYMAVLRLSPVSVIPQV